MSDPDNKPIDYKATLVANLKRKLELQQSLAELEDHIYNFESCYLEETGDQSNIARGWDSYLKQPKKRAEGQTETRSRKINDADRIFSYSSITSPFYRKKNKIENVIVDLEESDSEDEEEDEKDEKEDKEDKHDLEHSMVKAEHSSKGKRVKDEGQEGKAKMKKESLTPQISPKRAKAKTRTTRAKVSGKAAKIKAKLMEKIKEEEDGK